MSIDFFDILFGQIICANFLKNLLTKRGFYDTIRAWDIMLV